MDGLFHFTGCRRATVRRHGKEYWLSIRQLADYGLKETAIMARSGSPYSGIDALTAPDDRAKAMRIAAEIAARPKIATFTDESRFDNSMAGIAYTLWRALSVEHPVEFPPELPVQQGIQLGLNFIEWYGVNDIGDLIAIVHQVQEEDALKNSSGSTPEREPGQTPDE